MNCESAKKCFSLHLYGELSTADEDALIAHLNVCESCRRGLELEKRIHLALDAAQETPTVELLEQCRSQLPVAIRRDSASRSWTRRVAGVLGFWSAPAPWLRLAGAAALIAIGFFSARLVPEQPQAQAEVEPLPVTTQVLQVRREPSGTVQVVVDETRQKVLSGTLEDARIRELLLAGAQNPADPGVRAESLDLLKDRSQSPDVRSALLFAAEHDPNDGVRLKALEGLESFASDPESRRVLSRVLLTEENPGVRSTAVDLLAPVNAEDVVETLQRLLMQEQDAYIRMRSQEALQTMNASVETF